MVKYFILCVGLISILSSCIKDDFIDDSVDPLIQILNPLDSLANGESFIFQAQYLNHVGREESVTFTWGSSSPGVIQIDQGGIATAITAGSSVISVEYTNDSIFVRDELTVFVGNSTVFSNTSRSGKIVSTSSYTLTGSFTISEENNELLIAFADDYQASTALPGLYAYLSNNRNTITDAYEIAEVQVFSGAHEYTIQDVEINEYNYLVYFCKPFNVKVGDGKIN